MSDINSLSNQFFDLREARRPNRRTWAKHALLMLAALSTMTIAGVLEPFGFIPIFPDSNPQTGAEILKFLFSLPQLYLELVTETAKRLATRPEELKYGLSFSLSLLAILTAHESGHYVTCRLYGVNATLPFFIPTPPLIGPAGTLGAFIKILSPMPSRRATFDIGVAGPIAGFLALIPVAIFGVATMREVPFTRPENLTGGLVFSDPLLIRILAFLFEIDLNAAIYPNPFYAAAWIGLLVTSLNLIPSGQLDGGHAVFAIFGRRVHRRTGRIAFVVMAIVAILGWFLYNSPSGILFAVLLGVMMRIRHPEAIDNAPLGFGRKMAALLVVLIFILCFVPFPIQIR